MVTYLATIVTQDLVQLYNLVRPAEPPRLDYAQLLLEHKKQFGFKIGYYDGNTSCKDVKVTSTSIIPHPVWHHIVAIFYGKACTLRTVDINIWNYLVSMHYLSCWRAVFFYGAL